MFELILVDFARTVGAGAAKRIVLQLDNAGWHGPENLTIPDGVRLVFQPAHSPELQPAEHLWEFVDEPLVNTFFESLDALDRIVGERCVALTEQSEMIRASALFHWWPRRSSGEVISRRRYQWRPWRTAFFPPAFIAATAHLPSSIFFAIRF